MGKFPVSLLLLAGFRAFAAFEPCAESPWLYGFPGALFPRTASAISLNPAAPGMLEAPGFAVSASRPFGLHELRRLSLAGNTFLAGAGVGGQFTGTSSRGYSEFSVTAAGAFRLSRGLVSGLSLSGMGLSIQGYGRGTALAAGVSAVARPAQGVYFGGGCRGLLSTPLGGDPAVPRTLHLTGGLVPDRGIHLSASAAFHRYTGAEFGAGVTFLPHPALALGVGCLTGPSRLFFSLGLETGAAGASYGYATHPDLAGSHLAQVSWGRSAFSPAPVAAGAAPTPESPVVFPVNINTATERELRAIPGIGAARASAILVWLERNRPVHDLTLLLEVPGIGPSTLETLFSYLTAE